MDNGIRVVRLKNGEQVPEWTKGPRLIDALNQAGTEGWELIIEIGSGIYSFIFKHPRA